VRVVSDGRALASAYVLRPLSNTALDFGDGYWPKANFTEYNEGVFKFISEITNIHVLEGFLY
jgi:hypothetical protein